MHGRTLPHFILDSHWTQLHNRTSASAQNTLRVRKSIGFWIFFLGFITFHLVSQELSTHPFIGWIDQHTLLGTRTPRFPSNTFDYIFRYHHYVGEPTYLRPTILHRTFLPSMSFMSIIAYSEMATAQHASSSTYCLSQSCRLRGQKRYPYDTIDTRPQL